MSERISAVIYYDGEVCHTENGVIFLSENTVRLVFNQNIDLTELRKRIRRKIFGTTPMKILSITYRFCSSVDPVTYDSFDIKGARSLEAMVQTHLASGATYIELYVQFTSPTDVLLSSVRDVYTTPGRHSVSVLQNTEKPMFGSGVECTSPQDTLSVDGTCTSVARRLILEIRTRERHQVLVGGNLHPIRNVIKYLEEGMTYSLRRQLVRGPRTLQMIVG